MEDFSEVICTSQVQEMEYFFKLADSTLVPFKSLRSIALVFMCFLICMLS